MFWIFWKWKIWYFWAQKLMEIWYLLITEKLLFWSFREWVIRSFFEPKSWWKDYIYWLLRSCCFEFFCYGKYGLLFSKKADGKMIFTFWLEVFLSFPWYSRAWEIWFFARWWLHLQLLWRHTETFYYMLMFLKKREHGILYFHKILYFHIEYVCIFI